MTAPQPGDLGKRIELRPGMVVTGADWMTDPPKVLPHWATVPVRILRGGSVEVGGAVYALHHAKDDEHSRRDPCYWCSARDNLRLCDMICPYCTDGFVFVRKGR